MSVSWRLATAAVARQQGFRTLRTTAAVKGGAADTHGTGHWKIERVLSVGLLGLFPAAAVAPCQAVDMALAVALPIHNHMGMETVLTDYVHGETLPKVAKVANYIVGASTCAGLIYFNINDVGIGEGIRQLWTL